MMTDTWKYLHLSRLSAPTIHTNAPFSIQFGWYIRCLTVEVYIQYLNMKNSKKLCFLITNVELNNWRLKRATILTIIITSFFICTNYVFPNLSADVRKVLQPHFSANVNWKRLEKKVFPKIYFTILWTHIGFNQSPSLQEGDEGDEGDENNWTSTRRGLK